MSNNSNDETLLREDFELLKKLTEVHACSGFETAITQVIREILTPTCTSFEIDNMGNLMAVIQGPPNSPTVLLDAHMDELGFQVVLIEKEGFLRVAEVGGHNPRVLPGNRVIVHSARGGDILGIFGEKAIHLMNAEQRKKLSDISDLFIDLGLKTKEEVEKLIDIGDFITFQQSTERFLNSTIVTGKSFDDRAGCWVLIRTLQWLKALPQLPFTVVAVFASQEEIGLRGAKTAAFKVNPNFAFVIEVNHAQDFPGAPRSERGEAYLGKGPMIPIGPNVSPNLVKKILNLAKEKKIPIQPVALPRAAPNDAAVIQTSQSGILTALITIPLRYMHTSIETLDLRDLRTAAQLLFETLKSL